MDGKLPDSEDGGKGSTSEGGTSGNSFILVKGKVKDLTTEKLLDSLLDGRDTGRATDKLDGINLVNSKTGLFKGLGKRVRDSGEEMVSELLEGLSGQGRSGVNVVHERFNVDWGFSVGGEDLLETLTASGESEDSLGGREDVNFVLGLEFLSEMLDQSIIEVPATEMPVIGSGLDGQLTLGEGNNCDGVVGVADVNENDVSRSLGALGQVSLGDTVTKSNSGGVVDEPKSIETGDVGSVEQSTSLDVGEPSGNGDNNVGNGLLQLSGSGVSDLAKVGGNELSEREVGGLAKIVDLGNLKVSTKEIIIYTFDDLSLPSHQSHR